MSNRPSTALPVAYVVLRLLIVLNWVYGACILALLAFSFVNEPFLLRALKLGSVAENPRLVMTGIRAIAALGILAVPLNFALLNRLLRDGRDGPRAATRSSPPTPIACNAIAWFAARPAAAQPGHRRSSPRPSRPRRIPLHLDAGFSVSGWLAVILTFVLARVFAEGTLMREDLEGTV